jgi:hypothetical protein
MEKDQQSQKQTPPSTKTRQHEKNLESGRAADQSLLEQLKSLPKGSKVKSVSLPKK